MTAYELRISDWSSDVCSSDLVARDAGDRALVRIEAFIFRAAEQLPHEGDDRRLARARVAGDLEEAERVMPVADLHREERHDEEGERSEERRVGKECVSKGRSWWSLNH